MDPDRSGARPLSGTERAVLVVPLLGGVVFGLAPFFAQAQFATAAGYTGNDPFIYRLAGAATFGYAVALAVGLRERAWRPLRPVVVATLVFNLVSILACLVEIFRGRAQPVVFLILTTSVFIAATTSWILYRRRAEPWSATRDIATWVVVALGLATAAATVFGVLPQFVGVFAPLFGYSGADAFVYRQAGAATLGYAAMGLVEFRAPRWDAMRLPTVMALVFNGMSAIASAVALAAGEPTGLVVLVGAASTAFTAAFAVILARRGR